MSSKHFRTAALALTLLAGTSALAIAQSSSKDSPSGATQMQKAPASQSGGMSKEGPSSKEQAMPDKGTNGQKASGQNESDKSTSGQNEKSTQSSPSQKGMNAQEKGQTGSQPSNKSTQSGSQPSTKSTQGERQNDRSTTAAAPSGGQANLTTQQKTVIKTKIIDNKSAPRVSHVDFNVSVGVAVPTTVRLAPVPVEIVRIHPGWKSYQYFVYEEEVIIVDPRTHKIVEVITVS
jgi:hypothetical protein